MSKHNSYSFFYSVLKGLDFQAQHSLFLLHVLPSAWNSKANTFCMCSQGLTFRSPTLSLFSYCSQGHTIPSPTLTSSICAPKCLKFQVQLSLSLFATFYQHVLPSAPISKPSSLSFYTMCSCAFF